jgi:hypothetical protein
MRATRTARASSNPTAGEAEPSHRVSQAELGLFGRSAFKRLVVRRLEIPDVGLELRVPLRRIGSHQIGRYSLKPGW